jgi:O-antigen/teichoic acid export membrane protein
MMMFTQAFRFAYEPFIFAKNKDADNHKAYTEAMKYFIIFSLLIFLAVMFYIDIVKLFIRSESYYGGLDVVSIIMLGYILFGIYFNLSFWYKMTDKTYFGAIFSVTGCVITIALNIIFVPRYGYIASAWATLICNMVMMLLSFYFERKYHPIPYDYKSIAIYAALTLILYETGSHTEIDNLWLRLAFRTALIAIFLVVLVKRDLPLSEIPGLGKLAKSRR